MTRYNIAGIHMEILSENLRMIDKFKPFICNFKGKADVIVNINNYSYIDRPKGNLLLKTENIEWMAGLGNDSITVCISNSSTGETLCLIDTDNKWSRINISCLKDTPGIYFLVTVFIFNIIIRNCVLFHQGIVIHASAIEYNKRGIIFSAASGTGKSTQASMWESYLGAKVLNDDCPVVKIDNRQVKIYGTPCSGSKDKFINSSAKLSAIVILEQASENDIRVLSNVEAISYLMPRCFLAYYDVNLMDIGIKNLEQIICKVPVYLLKCKPDMEAVEMVYQCIK